MPINAAAVEGDVELLQLAATEYKANQDRLRTWTARLTVASERSAASNRMSRESGQLEYSFDREANRLRWAYRVKEHIDVVDGNESQVETDKPFFSGLWIGNEGVTYYLEPSFDDDKPVGRRLVVFAGNGKKGLPGTSPYGKFQPLFFFRNGTLDWSERFLHFRNMALKGRFVKTVVTITQEGQRVALERQLGVLRFLDVVDLAVGGNLIKSIAEDRDRSTTTTWEFQKVNDCFVPLRKTIETRNGDDKERSSWSDEVWIETHVNENLSESEFTLERLGVQAGNRVHDERGLIDYTYGGVDDPGRSAAKARFYMPSIISILLLTFAALSLALVLVRRRRRLTQ